MRVNQNTRDYFDIGDQELGYADKLERYGKLADAYFQADAFADFCANALPHLDELTVEYVESPQFDTVLVSSIQAEVEAERHAEMIERCRTLVASWAADRRSEAARG